MSTSAQPMVIYPKRFGVFASLGAAMHAIVRNIVPIILIVAVEFGVRTLVAFVMPRYMDMTENYILFVIIRLSGDIFLLLIFYPYCQSILIDRIQSQFLGSQRSLATSFRRTIAVAPAYLVCALPVTFSNFLQQLPAIFPKFTIAIRLANLPMMFILLAALLAGPIYLAERTSPHEALERSAELTSGRRIKIFLALLIVNLLLGFVLISLSKIPILFMNSTADLTASYFQFISITSTIVMLLGGIAYSSLLAVIYCMLQREKKGLGAGEVISVFE